MRLCREVARLANRKLSIDSGRWLDCSFFLLCISELVINKSSLFTQKNSQDFGVQNKSNTRNTMILCIEISAEDRA